MKHQKFPELKLAPSPKYPQIFGGIFGDKTQRSTQPRPQKSPIFVHTMSPSLLRPRKFRDGPGENWGLDDWCPTTKYNPTRANFSIFKMINGHHEVATFMTP